MSSAEAAQAMSKEIQLSLGPDAGPNDELEKQQGPESHRDIDHIRAEDGRKGSSNNAARPSRRTPASGRRPKDAS